jgi:hypothetical protein
MSADFYYLTDRDCSEFIVLPPLDSAFNDEEMRALICTALSDRYPPYKFQISLDLKHRGEAFVLIPVLGTAGADSSQLERPRSALIEKIRAFLHKTFLRPPPHTVH